MCGRFRLSQSSLILERTLERPLSSLDIVLILDCHFFIFSTLALMAGSRYLPCESRIVALISVVSPRSWRASVVGEPTLTLLFFSSRSIAFHSGPSSAGANVT